MQAGLAVIGLATLGLGAWLLPVLESRDYPESPTGPDFETLQEHLALGLAQQKHSAGRHPMGEQMLLPHTEAGMAHLAIHTEGWGPGSD